MNANFQLHLFSSLSSSSSSSSSSSLLLVVAAAAALLLILLSLLFYFFIIYLYPLKRDAVTALRDKQMTNPVRLYCKGRHAWEQRPAIKCNILVQYVHSKQLSTNDLAVVDLGRCSGDHMRRKMITDSWYSTIDSPLNTLTVGNVHRTLCKQKQT